MTKAKDPVCGMTVDTERTPFKGTYDGTTIYFCCENCRTVYESRRAH